MIAFGQGPSNDGAPLARPRLVLIDGPSGSGKSTFADVVRASWDAAAAVPGDARAVTVRMDDIYPGWGGLRAATETLLRHVIAPWRRGEAAGHPLWDWVANVEAGWRDIPAGVSLIVEGCGAAAAWRDDPLTTLIWVEASDDARRRRALERDGGTFDAHWDMWDAQWREYVEHADPRRRAQVVVRTDE